MVEREGIKIYPEDIGRHLGKLRPGSITPVVVEGRVVHWDSFSLWLALTAIHDGRNNAGVDRKRFKAYNKALYDGARKKNAEVIKETVRSFPDMTLQAKEILELPEEMFVGAAMYLTEVIW